MVDLYQRVSTHLSVVRSTAADPVLEARLSALVASARSLVTGVTLPLWQTVGRFFTAVFPVAVYRARYWWITVGVLCIAVATIIGWRVINTPGLADALLSDQEATQLVNHDFASYYSENPAADFAFSVWLNNAEVTAVVPGDGDRDRPGVHRAVEQHRERGRDRRLHDRRRPGRRVLRPVAAARDAGADDDLRGSGGRAAARLVLDRPGKRTRTQALATEGRAVGALALGLGRLAAGLRAGRGLRDAFAGCRPGPGWRSAACSGSRS